LLGNPDVVLTPSAPHPAPVPPVAPQYWLLVFGSMQVAVLSLPGVRSQGI
jgi:hypothetical protein